MYPSALTTVTGNVPGPALGPAPGHSLRLAPWARDIRVITLITCDSSTGGFDPRGVGQSTPVSCDLRHSDLASSVQRPWPAPDGSIAGNVATARRLAQACLANGGDLLRNISTRNEARDIDRIRAALNVPKISAWGVSYGAYAGAVYSMMFPEHTDRIVLDSSGDPNPARVARGWLANTSIAVEDRFPDFATWASTPGNPQRLATTPGGVRRLFIDLAARLDRKPIPWPGANPPELNGNVLRETLQESLYADEHFPALATLIEAGLGRTPLPAATPPPDALVQNAAAVGIATICNDVAWPGPETIPSIAREVATDRVRHPLTAGMPVNIGPCSFWPTPPEPTTRITPHGPSNVLMAQNLRDPSTPYSGALKMREAFGARARLISVDSGGHEVYLQHGNACSDRLVTDFLLTGDRPAHDTFCPKES